MEGGSHHKKGLWTVEEDKILMDYIRVHGKGRWNRVAKTTGEVPKEFIGLMVTWGKSKVGGSSLKHSREVGETLRIPIDSNSKLPCDSNGGSIVPKLNEGPQNTIEATNTQEPTSGCCEITSFWFSDDNLNLNSPNLMELLDEYPLDLVWDGL
ncbi:hypothetical protein HHK36_029627 [Tetracentron sinense]|uniref:Uncharacterized protein n=1 Tax=Tetracentron sinense TaxID=13715 RepID=A0A834YB92_TETSI|nr:hypothetical protein HHK36_029627 [Tetracentron sinense]